LASLRGSAEGVDNAVRAAFKCAAMQSTYRELAMKFDLKSPPRKPRPSVAYTPNKSEGMFTFSGFDFDFWDIE